MSAARRVSPGSFVFKHLWRRECPREHVRVGQLILYGQMGSTVATSACRAEFVVHGPLRQQRASHRTDSLVPEIAHGSSPIRSMVGSLVGLLAPEGSERGTGNRNYRREHQPLMLLAYRTSCGPAWSRESPSASNRRVNTAFDIASLRHTRESVRNNPGLS